MRTSIFFKLARSDVHILIKLINMVFALMRSVGRGGGGRMSNFHETGRFVSYIF